MLKLKNLNFVTDLGCESHSVCSNPDFVNVHFEYDLEATK